MSKITLEDLRPAEGSTGKSKRVGRGRSSGHGKTSCRGHNGEGQRSGRSSKRGFEGGQMPAYRRLPKLKGFQIINARNYAEINVGRLAELKIDEISLASLKEIKNLYKEVDYDVYPGHGDSTTLFKEIKTNYYLLKN